MPAKQSAEMRAAQAEYEAAKREGGDLPTAQALGERYKLHRNTITAAPWFDARPYNKKESKQ